MRTRTVTPSGQGWLEQARGAFNIGEEQGHGSGWEFAHMVTSGHKVHNLTQGQPNYRFL
jgi:hypothetical protein